jgi:hypothetical protein
MAVTQALGVIHLDSKTAPPETAPDPESFDLAFWKDVSQVVHDILWRTYVSNPEIARQEASRRGISIEQLVSSSITYRIMKKVDAEYV